MLPSPLEIARLELVLVGIVAGLMMCEEDGGEGVSAVVEAVAVAVAAAAAFICSTDRAGRDVCVSESDPGREVRAAAATGGLEGVFRGGCCTTVGNRAYFARVLGVVVVVLSRPLLWI